MNHEGETLGCEARRRHQKEQPAVRRQYVVHRGQTDNNTLIILDGGTD